MGEDASTRKEPTAAELAEMRRLVAEAMDEGAIGMGASYSLNHADAQLWSDRFACRARGVDRREVSRMV